MHAERAKPTFRPSQARAAILGSPWNSSRAEGARPECWLGPLCVHCKLVVESRSRRAKITATTATILMNINQNMAKLGWKYSAINSASLLSPKISDKSSSKWKIQDSNSQLEYPATPFIPLALLQLPTTNSQLFIIKRSYARVKYRVYIYD